MPYQTRKKKKRANPSIRDLPTKKPKWDNVPKPQTAKYIQLLGSPAHTYGNVLAYIQNYVLNLFPKDLFKTIHVNSKIAHRQLRNVNHEFIKKTKPMIIFRPRVGPPDEDKFLKDTMLIQRQTDLYPTWGGGNLYPFIHDDFYNYDINYQLNRNILYVDVICIFATFMQQINYVHYIQNATRLNAPFPLQTHLESFVPQELLSMVSNIVNIPMYDEQGYTKDFLTYLNQRSMYPVTYKLAGANGKREYFRMYPANLITTISDLSFDDGEKAGMTMSQYQITFSIKTEFYGTGFYFLLGNHNFNGIKGPIPVPDDTTVIPIYTDVIDPNAMSIKEGWSIYSQAALRLEKPNDKICINELLNESIKRTIAYHMLNGLPVSEFIEVVIRRQGQKLEINKDYTIDYETMVVSFFNKDTYQTYRIVIALNLGYVNELIKSLIETN